MTLMVEVTETLSKAASEVALFAKVADAVRGLAADDAVAHVFVSSNRGEIVVVGSDYTHVALRVAV